MSEKNLFESKEFQCIDKEKLEVMKEISRLAKGKSPMEVMDIIARYGNRLSGGNPLSSNEKSALLQVMRQNMEEGEKSKFDEMVGVLKMMGKL